MINRGSEGLCAVVVPAVLRVLSKKLRLQGEDVVEHAVDPPSLEPVVSDHTSVLEMAAEICAQRAVDPRLASDLRLLEQLETPVERELPRSVRPQVHAVPSTSTRPDGLTRTCTLFRTGSA